MEMSLTLRLGSATGGSSFQTSQAVNTTIPSITGNGEIGSQHAGDNGVWANEVDLEGRWTRGGAVISGETGIFYTPTAPDNLTNLRYQVRGQDAAGIWSDWVPSLPLAITYPLPDLSALSVATQEADGDVPLAYTIDADSTVRFVLSAFSTKPTYAQIVAGQDHTGVAAPDAFASTLAAASSAINAALTSATLNALFHIHAVVDGGSDADVVTATGSPVFIDTLPLIVLTRSPADDATDVAVNAVLVVDADDDVAAVGTWQLFDVNGAVLMETFNLSTGLGDNGGSVALSANAATTDRISITPGAALVALNGYSVRNFGITDTNGNALPDVSDNTTWNFTTADALNIDGVPPGALTVSNLGAGAFSITVITPTAYAGTYTTDVDGTPLTGVLLDAGPVCLVDPTISGTTDLGDTLTVTPGFWIYDGDNAVPTITYQWQSGGTDISGATALTFDITASEQGTTITAEEQAAGVNGTRTAESAGLAIPGGSTMEFARVSTAISSILNSSPKTFTAMAIGAADAGRTVVAAVAYGLNSSGTSVTAVTIGGVTATPVGSISAHEEAQVGFWQAVVPTGTTADVVLTIGSGGRGITVTLYRVLNGTVGIIVTGTGTGQVTVDVSANVVNGGALIAATAVRTSSSGNPAIPGVSWAGVTSDGNGATTWSANFQETASQSIAADETPRTISVTPDSTDARDFAAASLPINPV